jgi:hypothetical protein
VITFAEARQIVEDAYGPHWPGDMGTFITLDKGFQDATHWRVIAGAKEALEGHDFDYVWMDAPALLVDKQTGQLSAVAELFNWQRLDAMEPANG